MPDERRTTADQFKAIGRQNRSEYRAVMITTVLAAAALALFTLAWTGRCPLAAAGTNAPVPPTFALAGAPPASDTDSRDQAGADHRDQAEVAEAGEPHWLTDYDRALATAERLDRPILIDFAASWCVPCQMMDKHVWPKEEVREVLAQQVVPLRVDMDAAEARSLAQRYSVQFVPTILLVDSRGKELDRIGYVSAAELVEFVNDAR